MKDPRPADLCATSFQCKPVQEIKLNVEDGNCEKMIDRPVYGDRMHGNTRHFMTCLLLCNTLKSMQPTFSSKKKKTTCIGGLGRSTSLVYVWVCLISAVIQQ